MKKSNFIKTILFLQINIGSESQKSGIKKTQSKELYQYALDKNLNIEGLMCIPLIQAWLGNTFLKWEK